MKGLLGVALGVLTAIGGFVDIGDLVTNAQVGARFGLSLAWVVVVGILGICVYAEMNGRVAVASGRATFDIVRERMGPRVGLVTLVGTSMITLLTFVAEIGGIALSLQLISSVNRLLLVPVVALAVWWVLWKARFSVLENVFGLLGLALIVFGVAVFALGPDWGALLHQAVTVGKPAQEGWATLSYYAVALFGAAMTPYEVLFFSSGGVEEHWSRSDLATMRLNVLLGFPLGGLLSLSIAICTSLVLGPHDISVATLGQVGLPLAQAFGTLGLAFGILGFVAATFGAACETGLSLGYGLAQYLGVQWGKYVRPAEARVFHLVLPLAALLAAAVLLTGVDPVLVTEASVVFSAVALPLTYFPILVVANDPDYMGDLVNGRVANALGTVYLVLVTVAAVAAVPLMVLTGMGR